MTRPVLLLALLALACSRDVAAVLRVTVEGTAMTRAIRMRLELDSGAGKSFTFGHGDEPFALPSKVDVTFGEGKAGPAYLRVTVRDDRSGQELSACSGLDIKANVVNELTLAVAPPTLDCPALPVDPPDAGASGGSAGGSGGTAGSSGGAAGASGRGGAGSSGRGGAGAGGGVGGDGSSGGGGSSGGMAGGGVGGTCGHVNQGCCTGDVGCEPSAVCLAMLCTHCGEDRELCCPGNLCAFGNQCFLGFCQACGISGDTCCLGPIPCRSLGEACGGNGNCTPCGGAGEPCCANATCNGSRACLLGNCL